MITKNKLHGAKQFYSFYKYLFLKSCFFTTVENESDQTTGY